MRLHRTQKGCAFLGRLTKTLYGLEPMATESNKVTSIRKTALNVLMMVFFIEMAIYGAIKGLEGSWLGWFMMVVFLIVGISAGKGKTRSWAYSGIVNTVLLIVIALGVISQGIILFDLVVGL